MDLILRLLTGTSLARGPEPQGFPPFPLMPGMDEPGEAGGIFGDLLRRLGPMMPDPGILKLMIGRPARADCGVRVRTGGDGKQILVVPHERAQEISEVLALRAQVKEIREGIEHEKKDSEGICLLLNGDNAWSTTCCSDMMHRIMEKAVPIIESVSEFLWGDKGTRSQAEELRAMNLDEAAAWLAANILSTLPQQEDVNPMFRMMTDLREGLQRTADSAEVLISNLRIALIRAERDLKAAEEALPEELRSLDAVPTVELPLVHVQAMMRRSIRMTKPDGKKPRAARSKGGRANT